MAKMLRKYRPLLLNWFRAGRALSLGAVEGFNNKSKVTMRKAYGDRSYRVHGTRVISRTWRTARAQVHPQFLLTILKSLIENDLSVRNVQGFVRFGPKESEIRLFTREVDELGLGRIYVRSFRGTASIFDQRFVQAAETARAAGWLPGCATARLATDERRISYRVPRSDSPRPAPTAPFRTRAERIMNSIAG